MDILFIPLVTVILIALDLYWWAVVVHIVIGWLEQFNVVNRYNPFIYNVNTFLFRIVEPVLVPIRRFLPDLGGIDLSPLILILAIVFTQGVLGMLRLKFA